MKKRYISPMLEITYIEVTDIVCSSRPITVTITAPESQSLGETPPIAYDIVVPPSVTNAG